MKSKMLAIFLLAGSSLFARGHFSVGVGVGVGGYYPAPPPVAYAPAPVYPAYGPGYVAPPFAGAIWVAPRWVGGRFFAGHWRR
jgi:hypothetical protein